MSAFSILILKNMQYFSLVDNVEAVIPYILLKDNFYDIRYNEMMIL
jgi:hypothetical protein